MIVQDRDSDSARIGSSVQLVFRPVGRPLRRIVVALFAGATVAAACSLPLTEQAEPEPVESTTTSAVPPATRRPTLPPPTLPPLDEEVAEVLAAVPGRLVFTVGPSVGIMNPDGSNAALVGGGIDHAATQPIWSNSGALLAWSGVAVGASSIVVYDPASDTEIASELDGPPAFYLQWNSTDQVVSYLRNDPEGSGLEAGALEPGSTPSVYDTGTPYFYEWSPDRDLWVAHVADDRVSFVSGDQIVPLENSTRAFSTPMWLDGDRVIFGSELGFTVFNISTGELDTFEVPPGPLPFTVAPDGTKVAYLEPPLEDAADVGRTGLSVLDLESGSTTTVTDAEVFAWEWSPEGSKLAWMGLDLADAANLAEWHFWSVEEEVELGSTPPFRPSDVVLSSYMPFFTQYSVSHTSWAPDGSAYAFAGSVAGEIGIWVQTVDVELEAARISSGEVVFWSPDDAPVAGGGPAPA